MDYNYSFTERAEKDLDEIIRYINNDLFNPTAAAAFFKKIFENIDNLRKFPLSGKLVDNDYLSGKDIRRVVVDNYVMYYLSDESERKIIIIRIVYGKRNLEDIYRAITD